MCIRCAGIHRNLGVHISKVKSINLDSWSPEQIGYLQQMGNSKARAVYEANLPDGFRRPQTDSTLEAFIRAKYEQKKYIAKEWVQPPTPPPAFDIEEERRKEKERKKKTVISTSNGSAVPPVPVPVQNNSVPRPQSSPASTIISADKVPKDTPKGSDLLAGLTFGDTSSTPSSAVTTPANNNNEDLFEAFVSAPSTANNNPQPTSENKTAADEEADFFNQKAPEADKKLDMASILKLYDNAPASVSNPLFATPQPAPITGQFNANPLAPPSHAGVFGAQPNAYSAELFNQVREYLLASLLHDSG